MFQAALQVLPVQPVTPAEEFTYTETQEPALEKKTFRNRWSLGVLMLPSDMEERITSFYLYDFESHTYVTGYLPKYEAQLSYLLSENFLLTLNSGYSVNEMKTRYEYHYDDKDSDNDGKSGREVTEILNLFKFEIGVKYYLKPVAEKKVSPFLTLSLGKQFASAADEEKDLFEDTPPEYPLISNYNQFLEQLNSPLLLSAGLGAEYFINEAISVSTNFKVVYKSASASYKTIEEDDNYIRTRRYKNQFTNVITRLGVGLHLYF